MSGVSPNDNHVSPIASAENPDPTIGCGGYRSISLPTSGASIPDTTAMGAVSSADSVALKPRTACAWNITGRIMAVTQKPMVATATLDRQKSLSWNTVRGSAALPG